MAGPDTILRLIGATLGIVAVIFILAVGIQLVEPVHQNAVDPAEMTDLGWGAPQDTVFVFMGIAFVGLVLVPVVWWLVSPIRDDVRQDFRRPF